MNEEIVYLTFPTNKGTANLLTELAHIQGKTQPKLLDEICQTYIQNKLIQFIEFAEEKGIDISKIINNEEAE